MHPLIEDAAEGRLPAWAEATPDRRAHMGRVADLMETWGRAWGVDAEGLRSWRAAGMLHDALRDADPETLRPELAEPFRSMPGGLLHGPAAARRLEAENVHDGSLITAVRWHTVGHPSFDRLAWALYIADHTEPGRDDPDGRLAALRDRAAGDPVGVVQEVAARRLRISLDRGMPLREPAVAFWNALAGRERGRG